MTGKSGSPASTDRRVKRTRTTLQKALGQLIMEKPYQQIAVEDVYEQANVGRSTFYAHYENKDDLRRAAIDHRLTSLLTERRETDQNVSPTLIMLEHVREYWKAHHRQIDDVTPAAQPIREAATDLIRNDLRVRPEESSFKREARVRYLAGAFTGLLTWWLERGARETPEQIDQIFLELSET